MVIIISSTDTSGGHQVKEEEVADFYCPAYSLLLAGEQAKVSIWESCRENSRESRRGKLACFLADSFARRQSGEFVCGSWGLKGLKKLVPGDFPFGHTH